MTKYQKIKQSLLCQLKSTDKQKGPILVVGQLGTSAYFRNTLNVLNYCNSLPTDKNIIKIIGAVLEKCER